MLVVIFKILKFKFKLKQTSEVHMKYSLNFNTPATALFFRIGILYKSKIK